MKVTPIDVIFLVVPLGIMAIAFYRSRTVPVPDPAPPASLLELFLTASNAPAQVVLAL